MSKPVVFLDMDGVVADFIGHLASRAGRPLDTIEPVHDLPTAFNLPMHALTPTIRQQDFWLSVPVLPWARALVHALQETSILFILSRPWDNQPSCYADKIRWCYSHLDIPQDRVLLTRHKYLLSRPGAILIDDYSENCDAWARMGGIAIQFPARHNGWMTLNPETDSLVAWTLHKFAVARQWMEMHQVCDASAVELGRN